MLKHYSKAMSLIEPFFIGPRLKSTHGDFECFAHTTGDINNEALTTMLAENEQYFLYFSNPYKLIVVDRAYPSVILMVVDRWQNKSDFWIDKGIRAMPIPTTCDVIRKVYPDMINTASVTRDVEEMMISEGWAKHPNVYYGDVDRYGMAAVSPYGGEVYISVCISKRFGQIASIYEVSYAEVMELPQLPNRDDYATLRIEQEITDKGYHINQDMLKGFCRVGRTHNYKLEVAYRLVHCLVDDLGSCKYTLVTDSDGTTERCEDLPDFSTIKADPFDAAIPHQLRDLMDVAYENLPDFIRQIVTEELWYAMSVDARKGFMIGYDSTIYK